MLTLAKNKDIERVAKKGQSFFVREFGFKLLENGLKNSRYAIVVSLKVDKKAVVRNKIRRRIKVNLDKNWENIKKGYDILILTRPEIKELDFNDINIKLDKLLKKSQILDD